ncbi:hypothetical protein ARMGADRAFT_1025207 [Armillaria gallica]|uniref:Uncharacterized protein n=1 Tax=Armillaria gallica TaxID=47427 RepID=A0A2H3E5U5_ARMGA|nr:hypothetical protein ARMGADRAFT_1025207 [Armillaria gallica]
MYFMCVLILSYSTTVSVLSAMLSPLVLPIKMLMPIPEDGEMPKYECFVQFNPVAYYWLYCTVIDLILPYWHNKDEYFGEEVADLLKQVYNHLFCISGWYRTIACMAPEVHPSHVLTHLLPNTPFPGEDSFNMDNPPTPLDSYLLQCAVPEGALL